MPIPSIRFRTIWSGRRLRGLGAALLLVVNGVAAAEDESAAPAFDRPGIGFGTEVLEQGVMTWEQGLPGVTVDRQEGQRSRQYTLDSLWRIGLGGNVEFRLGADSYNWLRGDVAHARGGGDASVGVKLALPALAEGFGWALLGTYTLPTGTAAFSQGEPSRELALSAAWDLAGGRGIALYADFADSVEGQTWTFSPSYTFYSDERIGGYVEAGYSRGADASRVAGAGMTWQVLRTMQLDIWVLRGLDQDSPDWQGGLGVSVAFY
ncbi:MAG: transporter [Pseudomonas sp.]